MSEPHLDTPRSHDTLLPANVVSLGHSRIDMNIRAEDTHSLGSPTNIRIVTDSILGEGAFGVVLSGKMTKTENTQDGASTSETTEVAVKCSRKKMRGKELDRLREEVKVMSLLTHPNIVRFYFACIFRDYVYIVMEKCEKGNLHDVLKAHNRPLAMKDILFIGYQMVDALCYVHSKGCIHRDLKPGNFVFDHAGNVKLTDFGLSSSGNSGLIYDSSKVDIKDDAKADERENANRRTVAGTYSYMAPEIMKQVLLHQQRKSMEKGFRYSVEVDVYSLGVVLFYLATRTSPYWNSIKEVSRNDPSGKKDSTKVLCEAVSEGRWQWPLGNNINMEKIDFDFMKLVESMLNFEGSRRPELRTVRRHFLWEGRPHAVSAEILRVIRGEALASDQTKGTVRGHERLETLANNEQKTRKRFEHIRSQYDTMMLLQSRELAKRSHIIAACATAVTELSSKQRDERIKMVLDRNSMFLGKSFEKAPRTKKANDEIENSGRYSFRASTLAAWSMDTPPVTRQTRARKSLLSTATPLRRGDLHESGMISQSSASPLVIGSKKSQAREWKPTKSQRSLRSYPKERVSSTKARRTPSFWLDGPSQKFIAAPSPAFDFKKDHMKCPKKHPMDMLRSFPALNETTGGTDDYGWGFWCDNCHKEVPSLKNKHKRTRQPADEDERVQNPQDNTFFYHCRCGYDLCKACGAAAIHGATPARDDLSVEAKNLASSFDTPTPAKKQKKGKKAEPIAALETLQSTEEEEQPEADIPEPHNLVFENPSDEVLRGRPTFAPQNTNEALAGLSPLKASASLPPPHTPSQIVDKRFQSQKNPRGKQTAKPSLRMWWETTSPLHEGGETPANAIRQTQVNIPRPHRVDAPLVPLADMNLDASPKLRDTLQVTDSPQSETPTQTAETKVEMAPRAKAKHYVNTIMTTKDTEVPQEIRDGNGWIWHYEVTQENDLIYFLYMCTEESYGCLVMNPVTLASSAVVYDKRRQLVFYIPYLEQKEGRSGNAGRPYTHPHPYILTHYKDNIIVFREADVLRMSGRLSEGDSPLLRQPGARPSKGKRSVDTSFDELPLYLSVLKDYVNGLDGHKLDFRPPKDAKLVYARKFFFDYTNEGDPEWYMFRLSNGYVMVCNPKESTQIRWIALPHTGPDGQTQAAPCTKYKFRADSVEVYDDPAYFRKIRELLQSFDEAAHRDV